MAERLTGASRRGLNTNFTRPPSPFLKLPLEIREIVYHMLLTTSCNYVVALQEKRTPMDRKKYLISNDRFNLSPAILQVKKQISTEATRFLYAANDFIFFDIRIIDIYPGERFETIPAFKGLSREVIKPVLRITIATEGEDQRIKQRWISLITTPEAMPRLFANLWTHSRYSVFCKNWFLVLEFQKWKPS
jgi:hypothetical protein